MTSDDWEQLIDLLGKVTKIEGITWQERAELVIGKFDATEDRHILEEFVNLFGGSTEEDETV